MAWTEDHSTGLGKKRTSTLSLLAGDAAGGISRFAVSISNLLEIAPLGTLDPTPSIYNTTMYSMGGILCLAMVCNSLMGPVRAEHLSRVDEDDPDLLALKEAQHQAVGDGKQQQQQQQMTKA